MVPWIENLKKEKEYFEKKNNNNASHILPQLSFVVDCD